MEEFKKNGRASIAAISATERSLQWRIPDDYRKFLEEHNGGEGFIGDNYLILWRSEELSEFNQQYEVAEYAPGLILIGSNGGGEAFAYDKRRHPLKIVEIPFIGMDLSYARTVANSFSEFIESLKQKP